MDLVKEAGVPFILGLLIGYTVKKFIKVALTVAGLFTLLLLYLDWKGLVTVHWGKFSSALLNLSREGFERGEALIHFLVSSLMPTSSFALGLYLGLKKG